MATIAVTDPPCKSNLVYRHGKASSGESCYCCRDCKHCFPSSYRYTANAPDVAEKLVEIALNGSGVRDTGRVLEISHNTVTAYLKNSTHRR